MRFDHNHDIISKWLELPVYVASSSQVRRQAVASILEGGDIVPVSVPDNEEGEKWRTIGDGRLCRVDFCGSVHKVAETKLRWVLDHHNAKGNLAFAMDTVPFVLEVPHLSGVKDYDRSADYPYQFRVFHKPRSEEAALAQLEFIFGQLVEGYKQRKELLNLLGHKRSVIDPLILNLKGKAWFDGQAESERLLADFKLRQNYLACSVRVVTGIALNVPELDRIITASPYFDVTFGTIAAWIDLGLSDSDIAKRISILAREVLHVQKASGGNPIMIPGTIDYSGLGDHKGLADLLDWQLINPQFGSVESAQGIARGAPVEALQELVQGAASQAKNAAYLPFPEGFLLGYSLDDDQKIQAFNSETQWDMLQKRLASMLLESKRDLETMMAGDE